MIYGHFQSTGTCGAAQGQSDLFSICLQGDDVQDFDTRWDQILLGTSEMIPENVLEGLYRNRLQLQGSDQLQTAFAMYNQVEIAWRQVVKKLRRMVRQSID